MNVEIDVWMVLTASGEYVVAKDEETVEDLAEEEFGEDEDRRYVRMKVKLSLPSDDEVSSKTFPVELD